MNFKETGLKSFWYTHLFWLLYQTEGATEAIFLKAQDYFLDFPIQASFNLQLVTCGTTPAKSPSFFASFIGRSWFFFAGSQDFWWHDFKI